MAHRTEHRQCRCVSALRSGLEVGGAETKVYIRSHLQVNANRNEDFARG